MAYESGISWTSSTWNPFMGCKKISAGCRECYMFRDMERFGKDPLKITKAKDSTFYAPKKWKDPRTIFTCSWSDFFLQEGVDPEWRDEAWNVIRDTPRHSYQILTKRPYLIDDSSLPLDWGQGWKNVWLGVSVEKSMYEFRIEQLKQIPCVLRFISYEPALGPLNFDEFLSDGKIHWVIVGGESGPNARPIEIEWIDETIKACAKYGVACFVKQYGTALSKKLGFKSLKGANPDEWPLKHRVHEFPTQITQGEI